MVAAHKKYGAFSAQTYCKVFSEQNSDVEAEVVEAVNFFKEVEAL